MWVTNVRSESGKEFALCEFTTDFLRIFLQDANIRYYISIKFSSYIFVFILKCGQI